MYEEGLPYNEMSNDDLIYELKRMKKKCTIYEKNQLIYEQEQELKNMKTINNDTTILNNQIKSQNEKILHLQSIVTMMFSKYAVILRNLQLEKQTLSEIKSDCIKQESFISNEMMNNIFNNEFKTKMILFVEKIQNQMKQKDVQMNEFAMELNDKNQILIQNDISMREMEEKNRNLMEQTKALESNSRLKSDYSNVLLKNEELVKKISDLSNRVIDMEQQFKKDIFELNENKEYHLKIIGNENELLKENEVELNCQIVKLKNEIQSINNKRDIAQSTESMKYVKEIEDLKKRLSIQENSFNELSNINEQLQSDHNALLRNFEKMKNEKCDGNKNMKDLQNKLFSINKKLQEIESDHSIEMTRILKENELLKDKNIYYETNEQRLNNTCKEYDLLNNSLKNNLKNVESDLLKVNKNNEIENKKLLNKIEELQITYSNMDSEYKQIIKKMELKEKGNTETHKNVLQQINMLKQENHELKLYKTTYIEEKELLQHSVTTLRNENNELKKLNVKDDEKEEISKLNQKIIELKDCIHRECEERTNMLIEISELRDENKKLICQLNSVGTDSRNDYADSNSVRNNTSKYPIAMGGPGVPLRSNSSNNIHISGENPDTDMQPLYNNMNKDLGNISDEEDNLQNTQWTQKYKKQKGNSTKITPSGKRVSSRK